MNNYDSMIHYRLDISPELNQKLEELAEKIGGSKTDVLCQSITLMQIMITAKEQGKKFGIANPEQTLITEINTP